MRIIVALGSVLLVAACADEIREDVGAIRDAAPDSVVADPIEDVGTVGGAQTFQCGDLRITVRFEAALAHIELPDRTLQLPMTQSAAGTQYSDGQSTFWEQGGTASLELPDASYPDCQEVQPGDVHTGTDP